MGSIMQGMMGERERERERWRECSRRNTVFDV